MSAENRTFISEEEYRRFRFERVTEGGKSYLEQFGTDGWFEPSCAVCGEPIRWCLDMFTFTTNEWDSPLGPRLAHARCIWQPDAFTTQKQLCRRALAEAKHQP